MILDWTELSPRANKTSDMLKWKASFSKAERRVLIRKTLQYQKARKHGMSTISSQLLIAVSQTEKPEIIISSNGKCGMSYVQFEEMQLAIGEAMEYLKTAE